MPSVYNNNTITDEEVYDLYVSNGRNATVLAPILGCHPVNARARVRKVLAIFEAHPTTERRDPALINRVSELLERSNVDPSAIARIHDLRFKSWGVAAKVKDAAGNETIKTEGLYATSFKADPVDVQFPAWPLVQPADPVVIQYVPPTIVSLKGLRVEVVLPDSQIGYQRDLRSQKFDGVVEQYELTPIHDEDALDVATQIVAHVQPDGLTHVGDLTDQSEFSKYLQVEQFFRTTQAAIDRSHRWLCDLRSAMGEPTATSKKTFRLVDGNHDEKRIATYIQMNARAAFGLRRANTPPAEWPDLTLGHLLRLDELNIETCGTWPGSIAWLVEGENALAVTHDPQNKSAFAASVICGHTHARRESSFTIRTSWGMRSYTHYEIGCLCSLKPAPDPRSIQRTRVPSDRGFVSGWQQGVAVVEILEDTGQHRLDFIPINNGQAMYQRHLFSATVTKREAA